ncbi:hypothetical protein BL253_11855 [Pseudofrankia asymbiotica]|uniref:HEXXH motif domain-containing protein n=1 Tax=Pseudofrankia asymbiotica TaxID=1834516 RepID=A0A1V2ICR5_9ACTN|nr:hypothetical protein BL253_11855 [Pseudofrankia asymbiotica]
MCGARHEDAPLWVEAGGLHVLAAAAAVRVGLTFELAVPIRHGTVVMPTLGLVRLPYREPWEVAVVSAVDGEARLSGCGSEVAPPPAAGWTGQPDLPAAEAPFSASTAGPWVPPSTIGSVHGDIRIDVVLDDIDPYRRISPVAWPAPLGEAELDRWRKVVESGWALLVRDHPVQADAVAATLRVLVPMAASPRFLARSATSGDAFGAALLSEPEDATQLAVTLVHELQHAKLGALGHLADLHGADSDDLFYAPWREDPRPLGPLLQGIFAFFGVAGFWQRQRKVATGAEAGLAHFEFALWRASVDRVLTDLRDCAGLTALGHRFLRGVATTLDAWPTQPAPAEPLRLAHAVATDHYAGWRLHHFRPDPMAVAALAAAWNAGRAASPGVALARPALVSDLAVSGLEARAVLVRHQLSDQATVVGWRHAGDVNDWVHGAVQADVDWITGDPTAAIAGFERVLTDVASSSDAHAWSGLGLAAFDLGDLAAARALAHVPEMVRALHRELTAAGSAPGRLELARWLGFVL